MFRTVANFCFLQFIVCETSVADGRVEAAAKANNFAVLRRMHVRGKEGKSPLFTVFSLGWPLSDADGDSRIADNIDIFVRNKGGKRTDFYAKLLFDMGKPCEIQVTEGTEKPVYGEE